MVFTKSLLIKALGGVVGVAGTGVGVLAGTTNIFNKKETTQKNPSDNNSIESDSVKRTTEEQDSIQGGSSVGQESIQTGSSAPENQERSTTDGGDQDRVSIEPTDNTDDQQRDGVSGGGNLAPNPVPPGGEVQNRSNDAPGGLPSSSNVVENTLENGVSQEKQKGEGGKDSSVETVDTKENVSERQGTPQPGTGSLEGQTSDPNNAQNGVQTAQDAQDGQDNGLSGSPISPGSQSPQQPVSGEQNSPNTLPSAEGEGENKEQQENIQDGSGGQGSLQPEAKNPTNPDSGADSHRAQTSDISQPSNSAPEAGQTGGDNTGSTPPGSSDVPGTGGAPGSTPSNEPGTGGDGTTGGGSESSDISTTDQATQSQSKEDKINAKLKTLNIPSECNFSSESTSTTCSINKDQLNQMKFQNEDGNSENGNVDSLSENIQLKIEIPSENKKTAYGLNDSEDENNLLFILSGIKNQIEVVDDNLTVYPNTNPEFKIEGEDLKWIWSTFSDLAKKVGIKKEENNSSYKFESTTTLKYSLDSGTTINTLSSPNTSGTIDVTDNEDNYNQGVKVTFREKVTGTGSDSLDANTCYEIKYKDGDNEGWYLSLVKPKVTQPTTGES